MILLLVLSVWMLVLWLAVGLCAAARLGDRTRVGEAPLSIGLDGPAREAWEPATVPAVAALAASRAEGDEPEKTLAMTGSLAA